MQARPMRLAAEDLMQNQVSTLFDLFHPRSSCRSHAVGAYIKQESIPSVGSSLEDPRKRQALMDTNMYKMRATIPSQSIFRY